MRLFEGSYEEMERILERSKRGRVRVNGVTVSPATRK